MDASEKSRELMNKNNKWQKVIEFIETADPSKEELSEYIQKIGVKAVTPQATKSDQIPKRKSNYQIRALRRGFIKHGN